MITQGQIQEAVELLRDGAKNPTKIILFGSYARGDSSKDSDLDFLVVEKELKARRKEMVRLRRLVSRLRIPMDIIVVSDKVFHDWADTPGTVIHEAASEGRVVYEAS